MREGFQRNERQQWVFRGGQSAWSLAVEIASNCSGFLLDVEDERVADEEISCYNCRYRRWTADSFICCQP